MQVVKSFTCVYLFWLITIQCQSQIIHGYYVSKDNPWRQEFRFEKNQTFSSRSINAFDHVTIYKEGYYLFQNDTLILACDKKGPSITNSEFEVLEKSNQSRGPLGQLRALPENKFRLNW